jgi:hypothetical protein
MDQAEKLGKIIIEIFRLQPQPLKKGDCLDSGILIFIILTPNPLKRGNNNFRLV